MRERVERGEQLLRQAGSKASLEAALECFDLALRESPDDLPALVGTGRAWLNLASCWHHEPAAASARADEALRHAVEIDPRNAVAHALRGALQHQFEQDWIAAERSFRCALALAPEQAFVHSAFGCHLVIHADFEEAEHELLAARRLDPQYLNTRRHVVNLRIAQGRLDDAEAELDAMQAAAPGAPAPHGSHGLIALLRGDAERAVVLYEKACEAAPDQATAFIALAGAHAAAGRLAEADERVARALQRFAGQSIPPYAMAIHATRCRRHDQAFGLLARALRERDPSAMQIPHDPNFAGLHVDPRWNTLVAAPPFGRHG